MYFAANSEKYRGVMDYKLVSGDSHVDLSWLPGNLFLDNSEARYREKVPRIIETKDGPQWWAEGEVLGVANAAGHGFSAPIRGQRHRTDRMFDAGFYDGRPHPADPELRLNDMILDGVDGEILYGITGTGARLKDHDVITTVYRIYNDWVADFCQTYPGRWYGLACIPIHDPILAAKEITRCADLDMIRGADLNASEVTHPIYTRDGHWDPLWQALDETRTSLSFHVGGGRIPVPLPPLSNVDANKIQNQHAYKSVDSSLGQLRCIQFMIGLIMSGACDRFTNLKFVMGECGVGWIPFVLNRMDHIYQDEAYDVKFDPPLGMLPSEYWYRQGFTTFQEESDVPDLVPLVGEDHIMWGSDYPHPDGVWPDSWKVIKDTLSSLSSTTLNKLVAGNAVSLYRMGT